MAPTPIQPAGPPPVNRTSARKAGMSELSLCGGHDRPFDGMSSARRYKVCDPIRASKERATGGTDELGESEAHITGTVWRIEVEVGDTVEEGDAVVILESMKMEMPVEAEDPGVVTEILCTEGQSVSEGATLVVLE